MNSLPKDDIGMIDTRAVFGELWIVEVIYNTDPEGKWVDEDDFENRTLHGPFKDEAEAQAWMEAYPDDTDVKEMESMVLNAVRPGLA